MNAEHLLANGRKVVPHLHDRDAHHRLGQAQDAEVANAVVVVV